MKVTRTSMLSGITRTLEIPITEEQYDQFMKVRNMRWLIPQLNADQREFLLTGATPDEWDEAFGEDES